ncbi:TIGR04338 family metallohydrolase [Gordonia sp. CPCC 205333]|uniref:TIGR04338 family metallohydrolase n=1 Tax=Gordonia sp. CPCC 205333 TaxID=3140790 RepID=UPI003AF3EA98
MSEIDTGRSAFYAAEKLVLNLFDRAGASAATGNVTGASAATGNVTGASAATGNVTGASAATGNVTGASAATGNVTGASAATGNVTGASAATGNLTATLAGTTVTLPPEAKFASVESISRYVDDVLAMRPVREAFARADVPLTVRPRNGFRAAEYRRVADDDAAGGEIAIPHRGAGSWALRELVVLHEVAHHLDDTGGAAHDAGFANTLIALVGLVLGPEAAFVYRVILHDAGAVRR